MWVIEDMRNIINAIKSSKPKPRFINVEKFLVSGKGCVIFPLEFKPDLYTVDFVHKHHHRYPSCNPVSHDKVSIELVELHFDFGIKVCWEVQDTREVVWEASRFV